MIDLHAIRTIAYRAFCARCSQMVSPHPRLTKRESHADLLEHRRAGCPVSADSGDS